MPDITRHGVTLKTALQEATTKAPLTRAMLYAYEFWHPTMSAPVRFVNDTADLTATLEATAPRDAGAAVEFIACPVAIKRPEESDTAGNPTVELGRADVSGLLKRVLDAARGSTAPFEIIERVYASDVLTGPAMLPPLTFEVTEVSISGQTANLAASYGDFANVAVPRSIFRRVEYPGLQR